MATKAVLTTFPSRGPREPASSGEGWETPSQASSDCVAPGGGGTGHVACLLSGLACSG